MTDYSSNTVTPHGLRTEIGGRLAKLRLARNVTQEAVARDAGISLRTVRRLEAGSPCGMDSFLRVALALGVGDAVAAAVPASDIRPIERVAARGAERTRARSARGREAEAAWSWAEESRD